MSNHFGNKNELSESISGDNSRFKRRRTTKQQAIKEGKQEWKCEECLKTYLSFPALYTHVKNKHQGLSITSKNRKSQTNSNSPIKKMKSILREASDNEREKVERQMILLAQKNCLDVFQVLVTKYNYSQKELIKSKRNVINLQCIKDNGLKRIEELNFPSDIMAKDLVFKQYNGRIFPISFGEDTLKIFGNEKIGSNMFLQLLSLNVCYSQGLQEFEKIEQKIWGRKVGFACLLESWKQWQSFVKNLQNLPEQKKSV